MIKRGGVLLVVKADDTQQETVKQVMKENGALDSQNLTEKWDPKVWDGFKEMQPPMAS